MKTLLICGGTGFIGRNLALHFAQQKEYKVYATYCRTAPQNIEGVCFVHADLTKQEDVKRVLSGVDIVIQAAATTSGSKDILERPYYHVTDNAVMNSLLLRQAFERDISHFIFFSCSVMYQPGPTLVREQDYHENEMLYPSYFGVGWTKVYIEKMCEFFSRIGVTKFTVLRHSNIYGPYDKFDLEHSHVLGATVTKVMEAEDGAIVPVWGQGQEKRDFLYIDDLLHAVDLCLKKQTGLYELLNIGSGDAVSIQDLVQLIINCTGKNLSIAFDNTKPTIPTQLALDCGKAKNLLGWTPQISLQEGVKRTLSWYCQQKVGKYGAE